MSSPRASRIAPLFLMAIGVVSAYAAWDNVLSDNAGVRAMAEAAACEKKSCSEPHGLTKGDRTPFGQTFEFTFRDGIVRVVCRRTGWLFGERRCEIADRP